MKGASHEWPFNVIPRRNRSKRHRSTAPTREASIHPGRVKREIRLIGTVNTDSVESPRS